MAENKLYQNLPQQQEKTQEMTTELSETEFRELIRNMEAWQEPDPEFQEAEEEAERNRVGYDLAQVRKLHEANRRDGIITHRGFMNLFDDWEFSRKTVCWRCKRPLADLPKCPACGWMICLECGACREQKYGGCFGTYADPGDETRKIRNLWVTFPNHPVAGTTAFSDWCEHQVAALRFEKYSHDREAINAEHSFEQSRIDSLWNRLVSGEPIRTKSGDVGVFSSFRVVSSFKYFRLQFEDSISNEYWFPHAFDQGFLSFLDS